MYIAYIPLGHNFDNHIKGGDYDYLGDIIDYRLAHFAS